jgi:hypothetical protein
VLGRSGTLRRNNIARLKREKRFSDIGLMVHSTFKQKLTFETERHIFLAHNRKQVLSKKKKKTVYSNRVSFSNDTIVSSVQLLLKENSCHPHHPQEEMPQIPIIENQAPQPTLPFP